MQRPRDIDAAAEALLAFLDLPLTQTVATLEHDLVGKRQRDVAAVLAKGQSSFVRKLA
jgi:hypothetical protein